MQLTEMSILREADVFVNDLLNGQLTDAHRYHSRLHTLQVRDTALQMGQALDLPPEEMEVLALAALFHDTGFTQRYHEHEEASTEIARAFLTQHGYPASEQAKVARLIAVTKVDVAPETLPEKVMKDADFSHLGSRDYLATLKHLRYEWEVFLHKHYSDGEWYRLNHAFLKAHTYHTSVARDLFDLQRSANQKALKKMREAAEKVEQGEKTSTITDSKSAQMMFKTALRNHIDLSNLADNKANIMLSVTALIITIVIPTAASYLREHPYLFAPLMTLLITCLSAMVFATLATRPIPMTGRTDKEKVKAGTSNLFFFGNFYNMPLNEYLENMGEVVSKPKNLEGSIMRDLYFLGKSLGKKYTQLRICYNIFMLGITLTVLVYALSYWLVEVPG